jgi:ribonucleoside-diphosphate reductase alpha subunit|tara:strand:+ start:4697 stop:7186 length:2490 start_codon:yes stop_codon:yes gene_type:complete
MFVLKRDNTKEEVSFDKVLRRLQKLKNEPSSLSDKINVYEVAQKVCSRIHNNVKTYELDEFASQLCSSLILEHPDYGKLASRLVISNHHKQTSPSLSETISILYNNKDFENNDNPIVSTKLYKIVMANKEKLNSYIDYNRDYLLDYFGFKTLERSYLLRKNDRIIERPQHMFMRVALGIHGEDLKDVLETYDYMSQKYFTHASPTLFNSGTPRPQMSSCFLLDVEDSIGGIYENLGDCAHISKYAGGIGLNIHNVRCKNSIIRGTNGKTDGIIPMLRVYNSTARYVNQSSKRLGSIAIYLEPWHGDIMEWLDLRKNHGAEEERARDLFYALWIPDLFMKRVKDNGVWSLMCPDKCKNLTTTYGDEFENLYTQYENEGRYIKQIDAQKIWMKILEAQMETGTPYMLYKDSINKKSNQKNIGTIKSSNLCCEIVEFTSPDEIAVCNLVSICLPMFIEYDEEKTCNTFNFNGLHKVSKIVCKNLNKVIDVNFYPVEKARRSNLKHRPIGIGVQGLADTFIKMRIAFDSEEAKLLNKQIFETIYHGSLESSNEISHKRKRMYEEMGKLSTSNDIANIDKVEEIKKYLKLNEWEEKLSTKFKGAYSTFDGSPASKGILQFDMWNVKPDKTLNYNWDKLKKDIKENGLRNSLLVAPMPTASTSQIMGNNECFEAITSNLYKRKTLAGEFILVNKHLVDDLINLNLWTKDIRDKIMISEGIIKDIKEIPENIRNIYKTVWEIKQKSVIDMAADRGAFIDQTQSMNLFVSEPTPNILTKMHFYGWNKGLKTGMYYLRTKPKATTQQFTIDPTKSKSNITPKNSTIPEEPEDCLSCGA